MDAFYFATSPLRPCLPEPVEPLLLPDSAGHAGLDAGRKLQKIIRKHRLSLMFLDASFGTGYRFLHIQVNINNQMLTCAVTQDG